MIEKSLKTTPRRSARELSCAALRYNFRLKIYRTGFGSSKPAIFRLEHRSAPPDNRITDDASPIASPQKAKLG